MLGTSGGEAGSSMMSRSFSSDYFSPLDRAGQHTVDLPFYQSQWSRIKKGLGLKDRRKRNRQAQRDKFKGRICSLFRI